MAPYDTDYGTITIGTEYKKIDGKWACRLDTYHAHSSSNPYPSPEWIHCNGRDDQSRQYRGKYDAACGFCYLGVGHTQESHDSHFSD